MPRRVPQAVADDQPGGDRKDRQEADQQQPLRGQVHRHRPDRAVEDAERPGRGRRRESAGELGGGAERFVAGHHSDYRARSSDPPRPQQQLVLLRARQLLPLRPPPAVGRGVARLLSRGHAQGAAHQHVEDATPRGEHAQRGAGDHGDVVLGEDLGDQRPARMQARDLRQQQHGVRVAEGACLLQRLGEIQRPVGAQPEHGGAHVEMDRRAVLLVELLLQRVRDRSRPVRGQAGVGDQQHPDPVRRIRRRVLRIVLRRVGCLRHAPYPGRSPLMRPEPSAGADRAVASGGGDGARSHRDDGIWPLRRREDRPGRPRSPFRGAAHPTGTRLGGDRPPAAGIAARAREGRPTREEGHRCPRLRTMPPPSSPRCCATA